MKQSVPVRCTVSIIAVRTNMVVCDIGKFFHCLVQRLLCLALVQIDAFVFQCVEIPFHRCVVVRASCNQLFHL